MIMAAFVLAGLLAAFAGLLTAGRQGSISPSMGINMVLLSFAGDLGRAAWTGKVRPSLLKAPAAGCSRAEPERRRSTWCTPAALDLAAILLDRGRRRCARPPAGAGGTVRIKCDRHDHGSVAPRTTTSRRHEATPDSKDDGRSA
jgi:hypothetical protein